MTKSVLVSEHFISSENCSCRQFIKWKLVTHLSYLHVCHTHIHFICSANYHFFPVLSTLGRGQGRLGVMGKSIVFLWFPSWFGGSFCNRQKLKHYKILNYSKIILYITLSTVIGIYILFPKIHFRAALNELSYWMNQIAKSLPSSLPKVFVWKRISSLKVKLT